LRGPKRFHTTGCHLFVGFLVMIVRLLLNKLAFARLLVPGTDHSSAAAAKIGMLLHFYKHLTGHVLSIIAGKYRGGQFAAVPGGKAMFDRGEHQPWSVGYMSWLRFRFWPVCKAWWRLMPHDKTPCVCNTMPYCAIARSAPPILSLIPNCNLLPPSGPAPVNLRQVTGACFSSS